MDSAYVWVVIIGMGLITYTQRVSCILIFGQVEMPVFLTRALRYVPAAAFAALVVPSLLYRGDDLVLSLHNDRLMAGLVAAVIAWRTKSILLTIGVGMVLLWILQQV
jgi:branched-subunit amino acid transport protein